MRAPILQVLCAGILLASVAWGQDDAAKAAKNPVAKKISLEYQSVFQFDYGDEKKTGYTGMFQPVLPFTAGPINFINRPMLPLIGLPDVTLDEDGTVPGLPFPPVGRPGEILTTGGVGDLTYQLFLSPAKPGKVIWGVGPSIVMPTASNPLLGNEKWSMGPNFVILGQPGNTTLGALAANTWSVAGKSDRADVNQFMAQYFVDYGLGDGWSLATSPLMTANWKSEKNRWLVPIGGGINKMFKGKVPVQIKLHAYWHAVRPDSASSWQIMFSVQPVILLK